MPQVELGNLPAETSSFVGRRDELAAAREVLRRTRLLTLTGTGGVGKTRLALRLAHEVAGGHPDGAWLVRLSPLHEPGRLPRAVAEALELPDRVAGDPVDRLVEHLADRRLLLILDTCEHLVEACAALAHRLLRASPGLTVLATSREPLLVDGEHTLTIQPFGAPGEALDLFLDRAAAMAPGFALTPANRGVADRLCDRLEGIPLAIELAAVRLRTLPLEEILARIDRRFAVLDKNPTAESRHRTLAAAIDWSHDLCTEEERLVWARLTVFPGDFDLEAAELIIADDVLPREWIFDSVLRLVEKSILVHPAGSGRLCMLDTIREYGADRLTDLGERDYFQRRHRDHYLRLAELSHAGAVTSGQAGWMERLHAEDVNLRQALAYSLATPGEAATALRLTSALFHYWFRHGRVNEGRDWYRHALELAPGAGTDRAYASLCAGVFATLQSELGAAAPLLEEAARIAAREGDAELLAHVRVARAHALVFDRRMTEALPLLAESLDHYREHGLRHPIALVAGPVEAASLMFLGDQPAAIASSDRAIAAAAAAGERWSGGYARLTRGAARWLSGDTAGGAADGRAALTDLAHIGDTAGIASCVDLVAACSLTAGAAEYAAILIGAADELWESLGRSSQLGPAYLDLRDAGVGSLREALPARRLEECVLLGGSLPLVSAIELALAGN